MGSIFFFFGTVSQESEARVPGSCISVPNMHIQNKTPKSSCQLQSNKFIFLDYLEGEH
jgi:hypothetical protein